MYNKFAKNFAKAVDKAAVIVYHMLTQMHSRVCAISRFD